MQHLYFQCKKCGEEIRYETSAIELPIGSGIRCPYCEAHYVLALIPIESADPLGDGKNGIRGCGKRGVQNTLPPKQRTKATAEE